MAPESVETLACQRRTASASDGVEVALTEGRLYMDPQQHSVQFAGLRRQWSPAYPAALEPSSGVLGEWLSPGPRVDGDPRQLVMSDFRGPGLGRFTGRKGLGNHPPVDPSPYVVEGSRVVHDPRPGLSCLASVTSVGEASGDPPTVRVTFLDTTDPPDELRHGGDTSFWARQSSGCYSRIGTIRCDALAVGV